MRNLILTKMMPAVLLSAALAQGQSPTPSPQEQLRQVIERQQQDALRSQEQYQQQVQQFQQQFQQGGGGRGVPAGVATPFGTIQRLSLQPLVNPAWWTNTNVVAQLGLSDDQKSKIDKIYESHKSSIASDSALLATQEAQLAALLAADPVDHNAVLGQIDRVAQSRADLERSNSAMTLEMREVLTAAQWTQLQKPPALINTPFGPSEGGPGQRNSGQRSGQRQQ